MRLILRGYQNDGVSAIYNAWNNGAKNVAYSLPCGGGKTPVSARIIDNHDAPACSIAHRQELISQKSLSLARDGIRHKIIGPKKVIRGVVGVHMDKVGKSYYDASSRVAVAGVDTLIRRDAELKEWCNSVTLWDIDEGHHILAGNKWGKAAAMFPNAKGLGVSATWGRADGAGLGRHHDGVMDTLIEGPTPRQLINMGFITDYKIYAPPSEGFNRDNIATGKDGDFTKDGASKAVRESCIVGDVVKEYLKIAKGKIGITFAPDIQTANDIARGYNAAGVPAEVVHAKTPEADRNKAKEKLENRELLQLVNVDLFGEGFDLSAIEVVSMARPTKSLALYIQQFMRALRLMISPTLLAAWDTYTDEQRLRFIAMSDKPYGIIIDHVYNVDTTKGGHGLPDAERTWSLDRRDKRNKSESDDVIPTRTCTECGYIYERIYKICTTCGHEPIPADRSGPEFVDGDLTEISPEALAIMRGEVAKVDMSAEDYKTEMLAKNAPYIYVHVNRHVKQQEMQEALRNSMAWWAGYQRELGRSDDESYRRFYFAFKIDVLRAKALNRADAITLANKINNHLGVLANG